MKILVIASLAESLVNFRGALLKSLVKAGLEVHVAAPDFDVDHRTNQALAMMGIKAHKISMSRTGVNPIADFVCLVSLLKLVLCVRPTMTLAYTAKPVIYGTIAAWLGGVRQRYALITGLGYAFTGVATGARKFTKFAIQSLYKFALNKATKVFFQNTDDEMLFKQLRLVSQKIPTCVVNGSGVDVSFYNAVPLPMAPLKFLMIARLLGDKGVREYVEAARRVRSDYPEIEFRLVGWIDNNPDAIKQGELDSWVEEGVINYMGRLNDVRDAIEKSTVYVLPSYREGTPRTVLEAMAMGRAIITTDAPGCRETVVDDYNGILVKVKSIDDLERAMVRFVLDPALAINMGLCSRRVALEKYDVNMVNEIMLKEMGIK